MNITVKNINIDNTFRDINISSDSKDVFNKILLDAKEALNNDSESRYCNAVNYTNYIGLTLNSKDIKISSYHFKPLGFTESEEVIATVEDTTTTITETTETTPTTEGETGGTTTTETTETVDDTTTTTTTDVTVDVGDSGTTTTTTEETTTIITETTDTVNVSEIVPIVFDSVLPNYLFSVPLNLKKIVITHNQLSDYQIGDVRDYTVVGIDDFLKDHIYEFTNDDIPLYYKDETKFVESIKIVKDSVGAVYMPEYGFNGIGNINQLQGYTLNIPTGIVYLKCKGEEFDPIQTVIDFDFEFVNGWNTMSWPSLSVINIVDFLAPYVAEGKVSLVKNNEGQVYIPQWNFNGIGNFEPGQAYLIKLNL